MSDVSDSSGRVTMHVSGVRCKLVFLTKSIPGAFLLDANSDVMRETQTSRDRMDRVCMKLEHVSTFVD